MTDFKVGDEIWWWRTHGYHSEPIVPEDLYLERLIIDEIDEDGFMDAEGGWICVDDSLKSYKSRHEAIEAMIERLKNAQDK